MDTLHEAAIFLGAAVLAVPLFQRLKLGAVLGYLAAGMVIGPFGLGFFGEVEDILHFSELGVVLLLFLVGLELEPRRLWDMRRDVLGLGGLQFAASALLLGVLAWLTGVSVQAALLVGSALALSSTAFALQVLGERNELARPHGRKAFSILLFQDLAVIPLLAVVALLGASNEASTNASSWLSAGLALAAIVGVVVGGRLLLRPFFRILAAGHTQEVVTAGALFVVIGVSVLMAAVGLSMALGAFLAGVLLADSEFRHDLEASVEPFKGLLMGLFFLAVGMAADLALLANRPLVVLAWVAALVACKLAVLYALGGSAGLSRQPRWSFAIALSQGGEFAFVLVTAAAAGNALDRATADLVVVVVTFSMATTPLLFAALGALGAKGDATKDPRAQESSGYGERPVIIAGFGRFGQVVGRVLRAKHIPFTALEANPTQVDFVRRYGNEVHYGDAARLDLLRAAHAAEARVLVVAVDDVEAAVKIVEVAKASFPRLKVLARARNRTHALALTAAGADHVMREAFASSLETAEEVLNTLGLPFGEAREAIRGFRLHDERVLAAQLEVRDDEAALIATARASAEQLERLFEEDRSREPGGAPMKIPG